MSKYPIKMLSDEQGTPFVPLVTPDSIYTVDDEGFEQVIGKKLEADNLIEGEHINIEKDGNNCTISAELPVGLTVINNLTTAGSGYGVLDAYQGKVLKDSIPTVVDNLESTDANKVLSANQGRVLDGKTVPEGGKTGQVLKKSSDNNHELEWGDAADPNAIVGDGTIMSIIELSYADYKTLEAAGELKADTEYHITDVENGTATYMTEEQIQEMIDDSIEDSTKPVYIQENTDLNTMVTSGYYISEKTAITSTLQNTPPGLTIGFALYVTQDAGVGVSNYHQTAIRDEKIFTRSTNDGGISWTSWQIITGYRVGDVFVTSTNTNPGTTLGGTWELIDKAFRIEQFAYSGDDISNYVTIENNSVDISQFVVRRIGHNVDIRIEMTTSVDLADTAVHLMTINVNALGIKGFSYTKYGQLIGADGGNGFLNLTIYDDGQINSVDVLVRGDAPGTLPAGSSPRFYYSQEIVMANMLDAYCNQFYWKRTA